MHINIRLEFTCFLLKPRIRVPTTKIATICLFLASCMSVTNMLIINYIYRRCAFQMAYSIFTFEQNLPQSSLL